MIAQVNEGNPVCPKHGYATKGIQFICFLLFYTNLPDDYNRTLRVLCVFFFLVIIMQELSHFASKFSLLLLLLLLQLAAS